MKTTYLFVILLFSIGSIQLLSAQESPENKKIDESWKFSVSPYLWMPNIKGDLTVLNEDIPVDLKFSNDLLSDLKLAGMIHLEAKKNKWAFMIDAFYAKLGTKGEYKGIPDNTVDIRLRVTQTLLEGGVAYTFAQTGGFSMDGLVGLRYFDTGSNVKIKDNGTQIADIHTDFNFFDPFVGMRFRNDWNKWAIGARADVGFGRHRNYSYKINGLVSYKFSQLFTTSIGYQIYKPDYTKDNIDYNLGNEGFFIGFTFNL